MRILGIQLVCLLVWSVPAMLCFQVWAEDGLPNLIGVQIDKWVVTFSPTENTLIQGQFTINGSGTFQVLATDFASGNYSVYIGTDLLGTYPTLAGILRFNSTISGSQIITIGAKPVVPLGPGQPGKPQHIDQ